MFESSRNPLAAFAQRTLASFYTLLALVWMPAVAFAAPRDDWEVMRITIHSPPDQMWRLVPKDYEPVEIEDLQRQLIREQQHRKSTALSEAYLAEAIYVVRHDPGLLVSRQSRWVLRGAPFEEPLNLGAVSFATSDAKDTSSLQEQLLEHQFVNRQGEIELDVDVERAEHWFSLSQQPIDGSQTQFQIRVPVATSARMLLSTRQNLVVNSDEVVVEKLDSISDSLPEDWPSPSAVTSFGGGVARQWWIIHLSGVQQFSLDIAPAYSNDQNRFRQLIRSATYEYELDGSVAELRASFDLPSDEARQPIRINVSDELRINSVKVDSTNVSWRSIPAGDGEYRQIEIDGLVPATATEVVISAVGTFTTGSELPVAHPSAGYVLDGQTTIRTTGNVVIDSLTGRNCVVRAVPPADQDLEQTSDARPIWQAEWSVQPPVLTASLSQKTARWRVESLTNIAVQSAWLSASCRLQISHDQINTNELRLQVEPGWFVDGVSLVDTEASDIRTSFIERGGSEQPDTLVVVNWDALRPTISFELDVAAHRPLQTNGNRIRLFSRRLLSVPDADQLDNYVVQPTGRHTVQLRSNLIPFQIERIDLPEWQRDLVPTDEGKWIFKGIRRVTPYLELMRTPGAFSSQSFSAFSETSGRVTANHLIRLEPVGGSVEAITLDFAAGTDVSDYQWSIEQDGNIQPITPTRVSNGQNETGIEFQLTDRIDQAFSLHATSTAELPGSGPCKLAVPSVRDSIRSDAKVVFDASLGSLRGNDGLELLPASSLDADIMEWRQDTLFADNKQLVGLRVNSRSPQALVLDRNTEANSRAWIEKQLGEQWINGRRDRSYKFTWLVAVGEATEMKVEIPDGWSIERLLMNEREISTALASESGMVLLSLPQARKSTVEMFCRSQTEQLLWFGRESDQTPSVNLEVLQSQYTLHIPPQRISLNSIPHEHLDATLWGRISPAVWWSQLTLGPPQATRFKSDGWTQVALHNSTTTDGAVWTADRNAVATLLLAATLAATIAMFVVIRRSLRLACLTLGGLLVADVLAPVSTLAVLQLLTLAALLATLLTMVQVIVNGLRSHRSRRGGSSIMSRSSIHVSALMLAICTVSSANAQLDTTTVELEDGTTEQDGLRIFSALIPVNDEGEVFGAYAYIPSELRALLSDPNSPYKRMESRILSAEYTLRFSPGDVANQPEIDEFSAEYRVFVGEGKQPLPLSLQPAQLSKSRYLVNGQDEQFSQSTFRLESGELIFQPESPGTYLLKLFFNPPAGRDNDGSSLFVADLPAIPSAVIRIASDSETHVEVDSLGRQTLTGMERIVELGALDQLRCRWYSVEQRRTAPEMVNAVSRVWLHAVGNELLAAAMLQIENPSSLPEEFEFTINREWEPIGTDWGDVQLVAVEESLRSTKYVVRRRVGPLSGGRLTLNALLTRKDAPSGSTALVPFVNLVGAEQSATRILSWSAEPVSSWFPEDILHWPIVTDLAPEDWQELQLADQFESHRIPVGIVATVQLQDELEPPKVSEITRVHYSLASASLYYHAQWPTPVERPTLLRFELPPRSTIKSLMVDSVEQSPLLVEQAGREFALLISPEEASPIQAIDLELSFPTRLNAPIPIQRAFVADFDATSSVVRVSCEAGLHYELTNKSENDELQLERVDARPIDLITNLEVVVGQFDARNEYRQSSALPLDLAFKLTSVNSSVQSILHLEKQASGWAAVINSHWLVDDDNEHFAFFDIPSDWVDAIDAGDLTTRYIQTEENERAILCVIPPPPEDGKCEVTLSVPLPELSSGQPTVLPSVSVVARTHIPAIVALPKVIDGQAALWDLSAPYVDPPQLAKVTDPDSTNLYVAPGDRPLEVSWSTSGRSERAALLVWSNVTIQQISSEQVTGFHDFWIDPRSQISVDFDIPESVELIGVTIGGQVASWQRTDDKKIKVLLQPNFLVAPVRLLVRWITPTESNSIELPRCSQLSRPTEFETHIELTQGDYAVTGASVRQTSSRIRVESWCETVVGALPQLKGVPENEKAAWLQGWHPAQFGILDLDPLVVPQALSNNYESEQLIQNAGDLWTAILNTLKVTVDPPKNSLGSDLLPTRIVGGARIFSTNDGGKISLSPVGVQEPIRARMVVASVLAVLVLLTLHGLQRIKRAVKTLLAQHPWLYWLILAAMTWLALPVAWPSYVLVLTAVGMAMSQLLDYRRATHFR